MANSEHGGLKMDKYEQAFYREILKYLDKTGHKPYRTYLLKNHYILKFTHDIDTVAYVQSGLKVIFINIYFFLKWRQDEDRDLDGISMLIRHEVLHKAFKHEENVMRLLAKQLHLDYDTLDDLTLDQLKSLAYSPSTFGSSIQNIAGDYHISKYYSKLDKHYVNALDFYGEEIKGLLGERDYPDLDWKHMSFEDIYDFVKEQDVQNMLNSGMYDIEYVDFDDDDDQTFHDIDLDTTLYIGTTSYDEIEMITDNVSEVKQDFDKVDKWYKAEVTKDTVKALNSGSAYANTIKEFQTIFPESKVKEITKDEI